MKREVKHELEWDDGHPEDDQYVCSCGFVCEANGGVVEAFDHGYEAGYKAGYKVGYKEAGNGEDGLL